MTLATGLHSMIITCKGTEKKKETIMITLRHGGMEV